MALTVRQEELAALDAEWRELLDRTAEPVPFLHPTWQRVWLEEFQAACEPLYLAVRDGDELVGVAPLLRDGDRISFVGSHKICDYMDFVVAPERAHDVFAALVPAIAAETWSEIELRGLRDGSPTLAELPALVEGAGLTFEREQEAVAPRITLAATWDEYLASLGKKHRHELRRKLRRLDEEGELVLHAYTTLQDVDTHLPVLLQFMVESRTDKAEFMSEQMGLFFHRAAQALAQEGLLRLYELELDNKPVASVLCFDQGGQLFMYNSGYDPEYAPLSVGVASKALCLQEAIECGKHCIDLLRGDESYKYHLGGEDQIIYRAVIRRA
ncbi:MAG: GNAT family N-acetyltransferase [Dehalococcoidia bacterium]